MPSSPAIRVIVRLPYNRPEDATANPHRVRSASHNFSYRCISEPLLLSLGRMERRQGAHSLGGHCEEPHYRGC